MIINDDSAVYNCERFNLLKIIIIPLIKTLTCVTSREKLNISQTEFWNKCKLLYFQFKIIQFKIIKFDIELFYSKTRLNHLPARHSTAPGLILSVHCRTKDNTETTILPDWLHCKYALNDSAVLLRVEPRIGHKATRRQYTCARIQNSSGSNDIAQIGHKTTTTTYTIKSEKTSTPSVVCQRQQHWENTHTHVL